MKKIVYLSFRSLAAKFSGYGLRRHFPWLNQLYKIINRFLSPAKVNVQGHEFFLDHGDSLGLAVKGGYETAETKVILDNVSVGQVVLDIGANIGYFTLNFARLVGEPGKVYAFEPDPATFKLLERNVIENGYHNVILEPMAVSNVSSQAFLQRDRYNNLDHRLTYESGAPNALSIASTRLDDYFQLISGKIDFIKMDIQGAEILALEGMRDLLARSNHAKLLTEFWPEGLKRFAGNNGAALYLKTLKDHGFALFEIDRLSSNLSQRSPEELLAKYPSASDKYANLFCVK